MTPEERAEKALEDASIPSLVADKDLRVQYVAEAIREAVREAVAPLLTNQNAQAIPYVVALDPMRDDATNPSALPWRRLVIDGSRTPDSDVTAAARALLAALPVCSQGACTRRATREGFVPPDYSPIACDECTPWGSWSDSEVVPLGYTDAARALAAALAKLDAS